MCQIRVCELDKDIEKCQDIQNTNIFKNKKVHDMFKWYEESNVYIKNIVKKMKTFS